MVKFEPAILVNGKLQVEFGTGTPDIDCFRDTFQRFYEIRFLLKKL